MFTLELLADLRSPEGEGLIAAAEEWVEEPLRGIEALRKLAPPELAAAAYEQARLRKRGAAKFSRAGELFFTAELLEQASGEVAARWRARRFAGYPAVADLCSGLGGDTAALAAGGRVVAVDRSLLAAHLTAVTCRAYGVGERVLTVCGAVPDALPRAAAAFADPGRRRGTTGGTFRTRRLEEMSPPFSALLGLRARVPDLGVKLSPATAHAELDAALAGIAHEREAISVSGECRELALWTGELARARRTATRLPEGLSLTGTGEEELDIRGAGCYLYEPDAALIRARLVARLAEEAGAWGVDRELAYLSADRLLTTPWLTAYRIEAPRPFSRKALAEVLRQRGAGDVVVKTRGFAEDPAVIRRQVRAALRGGKGAPCPVVFLTRLGGRAVMILGERLGAGTESTPGRGPAAP